MAMNFIQGHQLVGDMEADPVRMGGASDARGAAGAQEHFAQRKTPGSRVVLDDWACLRCCIYR
eukprot:5066223-Pyramimonas_sp.AAC.1